MASVTFKVLGDGTLKLEADAEARAELRAALDDPERGYPGALAHLVDLAFEDGWSSVAPEWVGALTQSPIFARSENVVRDGDGEVATVDGNVWWFPNYMVLNEIAILADTGTVVFSPDSENVPEEVRPAAVLAAPPTAAPQPGFGPG